jgi:hypothetical protein
MRKAGGVQHHLLQSDVFFAVLCKLRDKRRNRRGQIHGIFAQELPNSGSNEGFGCGKETVSSFRFRVPDGLVYDNFAFEPDRELATRKKTLIHLPSAAFNQLSDSVLINMVFTHPLGLPLTSLSRLENWS